MPSNFSYLDLKDAYLGYFDDYLLLGLTPHFKKAKQPIPQNKTLQAEPQSLKAKQPSTNDTFEVAMDRFAQRFIDNLFSRYDELQR